MRPSYASSILQGLHKPASCSHQFKLLYVPQTCYLFSCLAGFLFALNPIHSLVSFSRPGCLKWKGSVPRHVCISACAACAARSLGHSLSNSPSSLLRPPLGCLPYSPRTTSTASRISARTDHRGLDVGPPQPFLRIMLLTASTLRWPAYHPTPP